MQFGPSGRRVRIVADTNTLVSGSLWRGNPGRVLDAVRDGRLTLVLTPQLWVEFVEVLDRPKFAARLALLGLTPTMLAIGLRKHVDWKEEAQVPMPPALRDAKDWLVLAAAAGARADAIVTGDDDLIALKSFEGIAILTPRELLEKLRLPVE